MPAFLRLTIKRLRHGSRTAHGAEGQNLNRIVAAIVPDPDNIAGMDLPRRFCRLFVEVNAAKLAGMGRQCAGLEEANCPEPLIDS